MYLNTKLEEFDGNINVAFIGCGKFISMFLSQYNQLKKIKIDTIIDLKIDQAKKNCLNSGLTEDTIKEINFATEALLINKFSLRSLSFESECSLETTMSSTSVTETLDQSKSDLLRSLKIFTGLEPPLTTKLALPLLSILFFKAS